MSVLFRLNAVFRIFARVIQVLDFQFLPQRSDSLQNLQGRPAFSSVSHEKEEWNFRTEFFFENNTNGVAKRANLYDSRHKSVAIK